MTCPFDRMVTNMHGVLDCIKTDFKHFLDTKNLIMKPLQNHLANSFMLEHKLYNFRFNHESNSMPAHKKRHGGAYHYTRDNFTNWTTRYQARVNNFRNYCKTADHITFIIQHFKEEDETFASVDQIKQTISSKYPTLNLDIVRVPGGEVFTV